MASFELRWRASTKKDLRRIRREDVVQLLTAAAKLADDPLPHGSEKLAGSERTYRIRVGGYRIVYEFVRDVKLVEIQRVRHRRDVYRR
ncbi:MAG: type II toxin-antitoxin system RelE/ParE family toxin [Verrucomicrobiota bacterium]|nr:type II toxin-antitoxin system RelE/ParE family toxin [Verrucomicrobiota bacterium]